MNGSSWDGLRHSQITDPPKNMDQCLFSQVFLVSIQNPKTGGFCWIEHAHEGGLILANPLMIAMSTVRQPSREDTRTSWTTKRPLNEQASGLCEVLDPDVRRANIPYLALEWCQSAIRTTLYCHCDSPTTTLWLWGTKPFTGWKQGHTPVIGWNLCLWRGFLFWIAEHRSSSACVYWTPAASLSRRCGLRIMTTGIKTNKSLKTK